MEILSKNYNPLLGALQPSTTAKWRISDTPQNTGRGIYIPIAGTRLKSSITLAGKPIFWMLKSQLDGAFGHQLWLKSHPFMQLSNSLECGSFIVASGFKGSECCRLVGISQFLCAGVNPS